MGGGGVFKDKNQMAIKLSSWQPAACVLGSHCQLSDFRGLVKMLYLIPRLIDLRGRCSI